MAEAVVLWDMNLVRATASATIVLVSTMHALGRIFLSHSTDEVPLDLTPEDLDGVLCRLLVIAEQSWPDLGLSPVLFVKHIAQCVRGQRALGESLATLHVSDLYLACACSHCLPRAIVLLDKHFICHARAWVSRIQAGSSFSDEVSQTLREKLLVSTAKGQTKIAEYSGRGPLLSWLRVSALRVAIDLHRKTHPLKNTNNDEQSEQFLRIAPSAEVEYIKARYQGLLGDALREALMSLSDEEHNLVRLYYTDGLSMEQVAALFGVNRSTIKRRLDDTCSRLLKEIKRCLRQHIQLTSGQLHSLVNQLLSRFEMPSPAH